MPRRSQRLPARVERFHFGAFQPRHVRLHLVADVALQVGQVAITFWETLQQFLIERQQLPGIHRIHAILLVNRLPQHDTPAAIALLEEIVEATRADHIARHVVHQRPLIDGHLGLRDGARAFDVRRKRALKVQDVHAALEAFAAHADKFVGCALKPGGHHVAVVMPHGAKSVPIAGVAPQHPIVHHSSNRKHFHQIV